MRDDRGAVITDEQVLHIVAAIGAVVVVRGPVESADFATWRRELRGAARGRGLRLSVLRGDGFIVVSDPDHVVDAAQREVAYAKIAGAVSFEPPPETPQPRRRRLRMVPPESPDRDG